MKPVLQLYDGSSTIFSKYKISNCPKIKASSFFTTVEKTNELLSPICSSKSQKNSCSSFSMSGKPTRPTSLPISGFPGRPSAEPNLLKDVKSTSTDFTVFTSTGEERNSATNLRGDDSSKTTPTTTTSAAATAAATTSFDVFPEDCRNYRSTRRYSLVPLGGPPSGLTPTFENWCGDRQQDFGEQQDQVDMEFQQLDDLRNLDNMELDDMDLNFDNILAAENEASIQLAFEAAGLLENFNI